MTARPRGWWYPYIFVGGFAVVVLVNAALFYFASSTFTGLSTEGAYAKGLAYNTALTAAEAQRNLGWQADAAVVPAQAAAAGVHAADLTVAFRDRNGQPLAGLDVRAVLTRPTQAGHDVRIDLKALGDGHYGAPLALPMPGQWDLQVAAADAGGASFQLSRRITLP